MARSLIKQTFRFVRAAGQRNRLRPKALSMRETAEALVKLQKLYTALLVQDLARAEEWYTQFLGRKADYRPMDTLVQWELGPSGGLQLTSDSKLGGHGAMSLVVADVEAERSRLDTVGVSLGESFRGTYSTLAQANDLDGNLIVLATPPSPSYPAA